MNNQIIIDGKVFRLIRFNTNYYVDRYGDIYSLYSKKIIKQLYRSYQNKQYAYVDISINGKQKHMPIHKLVADTWIRNLNDGEQINHIDDNQLNNAVDNLYIGTQKENIIDCVNNNHRVCNVFYLTIFDKKINKILTFCPSSQFIKYSQHSCKNGNINRMFKKNWFKKRFEIIEFKRINNLNELKGVTTMGDECSPVE